MSLLIDDQFSVPDRLFQAAGRKGAAINDLFRVLCNVDESAAAGDTAFELADIDIPVLIGFSQAQDSQVDAAAIVKVKLVG